MIDQLTLCKKKSLDKDLVGLFLPEGILDYFDLVSVSKLPDFYQISLEEKNLPPAGFTASQLHSKGFYETSSVGDFPIRGKACYLKLKRRRWTDKQTGRIITRDWSLVAKGTRLTEEFATFLKGLHR